jgi:hypothetical protein
MISSVWETGMPYAKGETPMVGDRVENRFGRVGKVKQVELDAADFPGHDIVGVEFEDGRVEVEPSLDEEWTLIALGIEEA